MTDAVLRYILILASETGAFIVLRHLFFCSSRLLLPKPQLATQDQDEFALQRARTELAAQIDAVWAGYAI